MCCFGWHVLFFFFFKQKTAYEMRISDWSSDVCSSDLAVQPREHPRPPDAPAVEQHLGIAVGAEACALGLKLGADLAKIVDLAVVGNGDPLVEALHRLRAAAEIDDRQPPMAKPHPRRGPHAATVGAAMRLHLDHHRDALRIDRLGSRGVKQPRNADRKSTRLNSSQ